MEGSGMGKSKIIFIGLAFLIGTAFMLIGLSLYGVIHNGASLWDGLSNTGLILFVHIGNWNEIV